MNPLEFEFCRKRFEEQEERKKRNRDNWFRKNQENRLLEYFAHLDGIKREQYINIQRSLTDIDIKDIEAFNRTIYRTTLDNTLNYLKHTKIGRTLKRILNKN